MLSVFKCETRHVRAYAISIGETLLNFRRSMQYFG